MALISPWVQPIGAVPGESAGGRPVLANTARTLANGTNSLLGFKALRWGTRHHQVGDMAADFSHFAIPDIDEGDWPYREITPIEFTPSPGARYLWVGVWYQALAGEYKHGGIDVEASITAKLYDLAGVLLDDGIIWTEANGHLALCDREATLSYLAAQGEAGDPAEGAALYYQRRGFPPELFVQTGWQTTAIDDEPRLLVLPSELQRVRLTVTAPAVRLHAVCFAEAFLAEI